MNNPDTQEKPKLKRGFAAMSPERRTEIARMGGASIPAEKRAFSLNKQLAQDAGRKGGTISTRKPTRET